MEKKNAGVRVATHGSGYGGKGFKFDETEVNVGTDKLKEEKKFYGIEEEDGGDEGVFEDDDDNTNPLRPKAVKKTITPNTTTTNTTSTGTGLIPTPPASMLLLPKPTQPIPIGIQPMIPGSQPPIVIPPMPQSGLTMPITTTLTGEARVQQIATLVAQQKTLLKQHQAAVAAAGPAAPPPSLAFHEEIEINDFPQQARWRVTSRDAIREINEFTGAAIIIKGVYVQPGRKPPPGERKLFLHVESNDVISVRKGMEEIRRRLKEIMESGSIVPDKNPSYGKYSVV